MKIYLDTCSIQRPLDTRSQIRISLEAEAILGLFEQLEAGNLDLISSEVLKFEISKNPNTTRQQLGLAVLEKAKSYIPLDKEIEDRAKAFMEQGIKPLDALHLASAEKSGADYFCTADDKFLKKARRMKFKKMKILSPIELAQEIGE